MVNHSQDQLFSRLLSDPGASDRAAPSRVKAKAYSAIVAEQQLTGPLASLDVTVEAGREICIFEKLVQIAPIGEGAKSPFFCHVCHARVLGEHFENPPIFWAHCPYVEFKKT